MPTQTMSTAVPTRPEINPQQQAVIAGLRELYGREHQKLLLDDAGNEPNVLAIAQELDAIRRTIRILTEATLTSPKQIRDLLFAAPLTAEIRQQVAETCPDLAISGQDLQNHHLLKSRRATRRLLYSYGWDNDPKLVSHFYENLFKQNEPLIRERITDQSATQLLELDRQVIASFGEMYEGFVYIVFNVVGGDIDVVSKVIMAHLSGAPKRKITATGLHYEANFCGSVLSFLAMQGYVTETLFHFGEEKLRPYASDELRKNNQEILRKILCDPRLQDPASADSVDCYKLLAEYMDRDAGKENPWLAQACEQSPFDPHRIRYAIEQKFNPKIIAAAVLEMNEYKYQRQSRELAQLESEHRHNRGEAPEADILTRIDNLITEVVNSAHQAEVLGLPIDIKFKKLKSLLTGASLGQSLPHVPAAHAQFNSLLLMLTDPKKVVLDLDAQKTFFQKLVQKLHLNDSNGNTAQDRATVVSSIIATINSQDPYLDIDLERYGNRSIRATLMNLLLGDFKEEVEEIFYRQQGTPISPIETVNIDKADLKKNFNTAAIGVDRTHLLAVAKEMTKIYEFKRLIRFVEDEIKRYYSDALGEGSKYEAYPYDSATDAFRDFVRQCVPRKSRKNEAIVGAQEYDSIKKPFAKKSGGIKVVYTNDRTRQRPKKDLTEIYKEIESKISDKTRIIVLSSKTRFGDVTCLHSLKPIVSTLKERHPDVLVLVDMCQSVGRSWPPESITAIGADIYLISGKKALGAGGGGAIIISKECLAKLSDKGWPFEYEPSSLPLENLVAMGLGLKALRSNQDLFRMEGNVSEAREQRLDNKMAEHMADLTAYGKEKAKNYGTNFLSKHGEELKAYAKRHSPANEHCFAGENAATLFGCEVLYPAHNNHRDYSGIITLAFPNLKGRNIKRKLADKGYKALACLHLERALRISFHYLHETEDIDNLFEAIEEAHIEVVKSQLKSAKKESKKIRNVKTSLWADQLQPAV